MLKIYIDRETEYIDIDFDIMFDADRFAITGNREYVEYTEKRISIDNGTTYITPEEALKKVNIDTISAYMNDDLRERIHNDFSPCTGQEFLNRYLQLAEADLII